MTGWAGFDRLVQDYDQNTGKTQKTTYTVTFYVTKALNSITMSNTTIFVQANTRG